MGKKSYYDFDGLNKNIPVTEVLSYYTGQSVTWTKAIHCPNPYHNDKNPSARAYRKNNICVCYSCADKSGYNNLDIVSMTYGCDIYEAARHMIEDFGLYGYGEIAESVNKDKLPVSIKVLNYIGLKPHKTKNSVDYSLEEFYKDSPEGFYEMVLGKIDESMTQCEKTITACEEELDYLLRGMSQKAIAEMTDLTNRFKVFHQNEIEEQRKSYDKEVGRERLAYEKTDKKKPFKPSHQFIKKPTAFPMTRDENALIVRGLMCEQTCKDLSKKRGEQAMLIKVKNRIQKDYDDIKSKDLFAKRWNEKKKDKNVLMERFE